MKYKTGIYLYGEEFFINMVNENYNEVKRVNEDSAYEYADVFLGGSCDLFALTLNEKFGYEAFKYTDDISDCLHCFCKMEISENVAYIDVRGITTDFQEFVNGLRTIYPYNDSWILMPLDIEEEKNSLNNEEKMGLKFAEDIIEKYVNFYKIPCLS